MLREPSDAALPAIVRAELRRSDEDTARWPDDAEFRTAWLSNAIYVKSRADRVVMILSAIELAMRCEFGQVPSRLPFPKVSRSNICCRSKERWRTTPIARTFPMRSRIVGGNPRQPHSYPWKFSAADAGAEFVDQQWTFREQTGRNRKQERFAPERPISGSIGKEGVE